MRRILMLMLGMLFVTTQLLAQNRTVTGKVTDANGSPIPGASVQVQGTSIGTVTREDGSFSIQVPSGNRVLTISAVSMATQQITLGSQDFISVSLLAGRQQDLQEVVVVGYSRTTREAFTGSAKAIAGDQLTNKSVSNVSQALAGEVAGVKIINTSGQPGSSAQVRIRGFGSVNGNRAPLYVVDGVPFTGAINSINPEDIASVTVLKDAAATSIYGSRGANGVIVVTTKTGRSARAFIEVDAKQGSNRSLLPRYEVLTSPEEYIGLSWEALYNEGVRAGNADPTTYANTRLFSGNGISPNNNIWSLSGANTTWGSQLIDPATRTVRPGVTRRYTPERWEDYAFQPSNRSEATVKFGGGDARTNYFTSFGYLNDVGYSINTDFKRYSGRVNLNHEVKTWLTTGVNLNYANTTTNNNGQGSSSNSVFWFADNIPSLYPLFLRDSVGNIVKDPIFGGNQYDYGATGRKFGSLTNAIADAHLNTSLAKRHDLTGNVNLNLKFLKNFTLENRYGLQFYDNQGITRNNKFYGSAAGQNGSIFHSTGRLVNQNLLNMLRYGNRFGAHNVDALVAHEANKYRFTSASSSGYNLVDNYGLELANAIVKNPTASSSTDADNLESYFGQLNYDYEGTYYVSGTVRRDGSSRFLGDNKWDNFGSVGLGWVVSKMPFMRNINALSYLKLKASYGTMGDRGNSFFPAVTSISIGNLNNNPSFGIPVPGNPDLTWEKSNIFQTGADFRLGNYLTGSVEYYIKNTNNLFFDRRVGPSNGFALIRVNDGQLRNQGLEFDLTAHILKGSNYFVNLGMNGEHLKNKITVMPIDPSTGMQKVIDVQSPYAWSKGRSIFDFYVRNYEGVDPTDGTSMWTVYYNDANGNKGFDVGEEVLDLEAYYAANPDKKGALLTSTTKAYNRATQYYIGKSAIPDLRGAFNLNAGFRGFEIDAQMLYSFGGYSYDGAYANLMANGLIGGNNWHTDIRNRWRKAGDVTDVPRLSNNADANVASQSSRFIEKADYLALNNIRIGYNIPAKILQKVPAVQAVSFWVSGDNLWLKSARDGFNPATEEAGSSDMYRYSPLSTITAGLKVKF